MKVVNLALYQKILELEKRAGRFDQEVLAISFAMEMLEVIQVDQPQEVFIVCGNDFYGKVGILLAHFIKEKTTINVKVGKFLAELDRYYRLLQKDEIPLISDLREVRDYLPQCPYVVDCLFGCFLQQEVYYPYNYLIQWINASPAYKLSCDAPSGINIDDGSIWGCAIAANKTVSMGIGKLGFYLYPANQYAGEIKIAPSIFSQASIQQVASPFETPQLQQIKKMLPVRVAHSHKGSYGKVLLIAGSEKTAGACILAGKAILTAGAGLLTIMTDTSLLSAINVALPEAMCIPLDPYNVYYQLSQMDFAPYDVIAIGPGLSRRPETEALLVEVLKTDKTLVIDADGLFFLKKHLDCVSQREHLTVITPHLAEYQRIFDYKQEQIVFDLLEINQQYPSLAVVLKGENSLIAYQGKLAINTTGNNALAKGGSGDVLTGVITGLLAQKRDIESVIAGVYVHSLAADYWVLEHSPYSLLASDLIAMVDKALFELLKKEKTNE